ncbi:MAG: alpha/beta hydrolase [Verrucomicrobiota bacterium]
MTHKIVLLTTLLLTSLPALPAAGAKVAASETQPKHGVDSSSGTNLWHGFRKLNFSVAGRDCLLVCPSAPAAGKPWVWRTEFFGHEPQGDLALLSKGWHLAYMDVQNMYGAPVALDLMDRFYDHLTGQLQLAARPVLEGFSRGGLFAFNWAARHPGRVACLYVDAPVCDFKSWPAGWGRGKGSTNDWARCKKVYGLDEQSARAYKSNPVDNLAPLAQAKIPILSVCGDADDVVPMPENTLLVKERYEKLGGEIKVITKPGVGHHPHSLRDPQPIVDFILRHSYNN